MEQTYTGRTEYFTGLDIGKRPILVALSCLIDGLEYPLNMMVDTGASWSMLHADIARQLGYPFRVDTTIKPIITPDGELYGCYERLGLTIEAEEGKSLEIEPTWFISEQWFGPNVIGWQGCLEHIRFGFDPIESTFYFAVR